MSEIEKNRVLQASAAQGAYVGHDMKMPLHVLVNVVPANAPAGGGWVLVKPSDPTHSWILEKVTKDQPGGSGYGTRMPQAAPNLCQPTVDTLTAWINAGALNN